MPTQTITLPSKNGEPTWEIAERFPLQGRWTEREYLREFDDALVEYTDGRIERLPVPTKRHQRVQLYLSDLTRQAAGDGAVYHPPYRIRLPITQRAMYREPDVMVLTAEQDATVGDTDTFCTDALLVMEVVSPDDPDRDYVTKRADYAAAGVPEYWIVDPIENRVLVLTLDGDAYREHGSFAPGDTATGMVLPSLKVDVAALFA